MGKGGGGGKAGSNKTGRGRKKKDVTYIAVHGMQWKEHESAAFTHMSGQYWWICGSCKTGATIKEWSSIQLWCAFLLFYKNRTCSSFLEVIPAWNILDMQSLNPHIWLTAAIFKSHGTRRCLAGRNCHLVLRVFGVYSSYLAFLISLEHVYKRGGIKALTSLRRGGSCLGIRRTGIWIPPVC